MAPLVLGLAIAVALTAWLLARPTAPPTSDRSAGVGWDATGQRAACHGSTRDRSGPLTVACSLVVPVGCPSWSPPTRTRTASRWRDRWCRRSTPPAWCSTTRSASVTSPSPGGTGWTLRSSTRLDELTIHRGGGRLGRGPRVPLGLVLPGDRGRASPSPMEVDGLHRGHLRGPDHGEHLPVHRRGPGYRPLRHDDDADPGGRHRVCPRISDPEVLARAIRHEVGHVIGLAHLCDRGQDCWAPGMGEGPLGCRVMYWQARSCQVGIDEDDRLAVATLYPTLRPLGGPTAVQTAARASFGVVADGAAPTVVVLAVADDDGMAAPAAVLAARRGGPFLLGDPDPNSCFTGAGGHEVSRALARRGTLVLVGGWPDACERVAFDWDVTLRRVPTADPTAGGAGAGGPGWVPATQAVVVDAEATSALALPRPRSRRRRMCRCCRPGRCRRPGGLAVLRWRRAVTVVGAWWGPLQWWKARWWRKGWCRRRCRRPDFGCVPVGGPTPSMSRC